MVAGEGTPTEVVEKRSPGRGERRFGTLGAAIDAAMEAMPDVVDKIKGGKLQAIGALMGPVMKATRGQADAGRVREMCLKSWASRASTSTSGPGPRSSALRRTGARLCYPPRSGAEHRAAAGTASPGFLKVGIAEPGIRAVRILSP